MRKLFVICIVVIVCFYTVGKKHISVYFSGCKLIKQKQNLHTNFKENPEIGKQLKVAGYFFFMECFPGRLKHEWHKYDVALVVYTLRPEYEISITFLGLEENQAFSNISYHWQHFQNRWMEFACKIIAKVVIICN